MVKKNEKRQQMARHEMSMAEVLHVEKMVKKNEKRQPKGKADDAKLNEYRVKYKTWQDLAAKVLAAQTLMVLAGGYKEAFVLLDAVQFADVDVTAAMGKAEDHPENKYSDRMKECEDTARKVLAAQNLIRLGQEEAFLLLDAMLVATEGQQAHDQIAEAHSICASHHEALAKEAE